MRMSIVTNMNELEEGDHLVSEEIYKEITVLLLSRTHPEWSRPTTNAADFLSPERLPLNIFIPDGGGAFFVHWVCSKCAPDTYATSDSCEQCGKPRTNKSGSR